jgi:hypothetical protein
MSGAGVPLPFLVAIGVFLSAGAAWLTGQAIAETWRPVWQVVPAAILLAAVDRFLDYALFRGTLLSVPAALWTLAVLLALALAAYRLRWVGKMVTQYPWLYRRAGPLFWREISK